MKRSCQDAMQALVSRRLLAVLLLFLTATRGVVNAQHFEMNPISITPRYSPPVRPPVRAAPATTRPEPSESLPPQPSERIPATAQSRPAEQEYRPTTQRNSGDLQSQTDAPRATTRARSVSEAAPVGQLGRTPQNAGQPKTGESHSAEVIETPRSDGTRLATIGRNPGYVEHPIAGKPGYIARTLVAGGGPYVAVYRKSFLDGIPFYSFVSTGYQPLFYQWLSNPWSAPIYFAWGWNFAPWYGYYRAYFAPAPLYTTSALWLTDYLLAQDLQLAYENLQQSLRGPPREPSLSHENRRRLMLILAIKPLASNNNSVERYRGNCRRAFSSAPACLYVLTKVICARPRSRAVHPTVPAAGRKSPALARFTDRIADV